MRPNTYVGWASEAPDVDADGIRSALCAILAGG